VFLTLRWNARARVRLRRLITIESKRDCELVAHRAMRLDERIGPDRDPMLIYRIELEIVARLAVRKVRRFPARRLGALDLSRDTARGPPASARCASASPQLQGQ
jgi:hypothetical protein